MDNRQGDSERSSSDTKSLVVEGQIDAVLLMEDRAQVTRRCEVELPKGTLSLRCEDVTPIVVDSTLRCRLTSIGSNQSEAGVLDVSVRREYVQRAARPEKEKELTAAIEALVDECVVAHDEILAATHSRGQVGRAVGRVLQQINERSMVGPFDSEWPKELSTLFGRNEEIERELLTDQWKQDDREQRFQQLIVERRAALQMVTDYRGSIEMEVSVPSAGKYEIEWQYQVPCALWRPAYTAALERDGEKSSVSWRSSGTVWQATGEDWKSVRLSFSTARPTLGAELPLLADDVVSSREKTEEEREIIEVTSRDEVIAKTGTAAKAKQSDTPPGLDDGGEVRTYTVDKRVDVPCDGRPHRLEFESWEAPAEAEYLTMPEKACFVFLRSLQENRSSMPLLAGPVSLVREGGFVGRSQIRYVAPRERFALSWGSEDGLIVMRDRFQSRKETGLRKHQEHQFHVETYLVNQTEVPRKLKLIERTPVSEIEQVSVSVDEKKTTSGWEKDDQGLLTWELELGPGASRLMRLLVAVSMPQNVHWDG